MSTLLRTLHILDQPSGNPPNTTLTEFSALCQVDDLSKTLLYVDVPKWTNKFGIKENKTQMCLTFLVSRKHKF